MHDFIYYGKKLLYRLGRYEVNWRLLPYFEGYSGCLGHDC